MFIVVTSLKWSSILIWLCVVSRYILAKNFIAEFSWQAVSIFPMGRIPNISGDLHKLCSLHKSLNLHLLLRMAMIGEDQLLSPWSTCSNNPWSVILLSFTITTDRRWTETENILVGHSLWDGNSLCNPFKIQYQILLTSYNRLTLKCLFLLCQLSGDHDRVPQNMEVF